MHTYIHTYINLVIYDHCPNHDCIMLPSRRQGKFFTQCDQFILSDRTTACNSWCVPLQLSFHYTHRVGGPFSPVSEYNGMRQTHRS